MSLGHSDKIVYSVAVQLKVLSATTTVRFPCLFSVQWRTNNQKVSIQTAKYSPQSGRTDFNQTLLMRTEVAYDKNKRLFLKKETQVQLNLTSKSRADQSKLVGRVTIDLALLLNENSYTEATDFPLQFCSVNASLLMAFKVTEKVESEVSISELQLSYGDSFGLSSAIKLVNSSHLKEKQRESFEPAGEPGLISKIGSEISQVVKKQHSSIPSPQSVESINLKETFLPKEPVIIAKDPVAVKDVRSLIQQKDNEQKPATRSFKNIGSAKESIITRKSEVTEDFSQLLSEMKEDPKKQFKKMGSINSEDGKASQSGRYTEDLAKQRLENERLKQEGERHRQEEEQYKIQLEKSKQECELLKLELRQKKVNVDQLMVEASTAKNDLSRLRDQLAKSREESVSLTLKLAELREAHNKVLVQSSTTQRDISRLQSIASKYQQSLAEKEKLLGQLSEFQSRCEQLEFQKEQLQGTLNNLDQMHQEALSKCTEHEEVLTSSKGNFENEQRILKELLKTETKQKLQCKSQIGRLTEDIEKLTQISYEFEEAKHSWNIKEGLAQDQLQRAIIRVKELEDSLISFDEKTRYLEGENELLTENCRKNREEYLKLKQEKDQQHSDTAKAIKRYETDIREMQNRINFEREEKEILLKEFEQVKDFASALQRDYNSLRLEYDSQIEAVARLESSLAQVSDKNHELEELVININELRDKEREDNQVRLNEYIFQLAQHEGNSQQLGQMLQASSEKLGLIQDQLRGRENLILRLQEGLRTQVERSQELNNRLMFYLEKEQRMKETVLLMELESKKIVEFLAEQEAKEAENTEKLAQRDFRIAELTTNLQESVQYSKSLQDSLKRSEDSSSDRIAKLSYDIQMKSNEIRVLKSEIQAKDIKIKSSQEEYVSLQQSTVSDMEKYSQTIDQLKSTIEQLESGKFDRQGVLLQKDSQIAGLQGELSRTVTQLYECKSTFEKQTHQYESLCLQLKENEFNHEKELKDSEERYLQLLGKHHELETQISANKSQNANIVANLQQQLSELKSNYETLTKDSTSLSIASYKEEIRKQGEKIRNLEGQLKNMGIQAAKVPNLQRSLKIRGIELQSLKSKGKIDGSDGELLRLKDEEITSLTAERDRLYDIERQYEISKEKCDALATQLELLEEEKFNMESLSNERALLLEEAREENRKMTEEITIIGERNGDLEKTIQDLLSKQSPSQVKGQRALRAENVLLKNQLRELEAVKGRNYELQQSRKKLQEEIDLKEEEHMLALIDQQIKFSKTESNPNQQSLKKSLMLNNSDSKQLPNLASTYKSLKEIIDLRAKARDSEKLTQMIESILSQASPLSDELRERARLLAKQFQKLKLQILKTDGKAGQERVKLMNLFKGYQGILGEVVKLSEGVKG